VATASDCDELHREASGAEARAPKTVIDRKRAGYHDKVLSAASIGFSKM
jgi:hypothetical protein